MEDLVTELTNLGFSEKEAETYLAVVELGETTLSDVADAADVSKRYAYDVCECLDAEGFLEMRDYVTPTTVRPVPPAEAFETVAETVQTVESAVERRYERPASRAGQFEVVKTPGTVLDRFREIVRGVDEELMLLLPTQYLPALADDLRDAVDRDVLTLLLLCDDHPTDVDLDGVANVVRHTAYPTPTFLAGDLERAFIAPQGVLSHRGGDERAIGFQQPWLASVVVTAFLGDYWGLGDELAVCRPLDPPTEYRSFRRAVFDATLHANAGHDVHAALDAAPTDSGAGDATRRLAGRVVDTRQGIVEPTNSRMSVEHALVLDTGDGRVSVGGEDAFLEDYCVSEPARVRVHAH
ncbi:TrmB family transcriptional regulator sugar-binding domain-containing protein [Halarchaeum sp. P4]|uniref:TrmB family transcriptional regulator sugar-binding domain-containing protein n=1 Tax=Halarchaeum sp. P4 TaxID=3421639 RepID=UPI003EB9AB65